MFYSFTDTGNTFHMFSLQHLMAVLFFVVLPGALIIFNRDILRQSENEKYIRYALGILGLVVEVNVYIWYITNGQDHWTEFIPTTLCPLTVYLSSISMLTLNKRLSKVIYFLCFGAFFAYLLPDIPYGYNRFRFYAFFTTHGLVMLNTLYLTLIKGITIDKKGMAASVKLITIVLVLAFILGRWTGLDFFYLLEPPFEVPVYQQVYETNQIAFTVIVALSYYGLIGINWLLYRFFRGIRGSRKTNTST